jgi:DNA-binding LytR/AlgR family response regulator
MENLPLKSYIVLKTGHNEISRINIDEILYMNSDGNYTNLVLKNKKVLTLCQSLTQTLEKDISSPKFARIKRGLVVNTDSIIKFKSGLKPFVVLSDTTELYASRRMFKKLINKFTIL